MKLELFDYYLPQKFIAQKPLSQRDKSKLLVLDRKTGEIKHDIFTNLVNYINSNDVLVINESKVIKCRLLGKKESTGAKIECLVLKKVENNTYRVLVKPAKRLKPSTKVYIDDRSYFKVIKKLEYGEAEVKFNVSAEDLFDKYGKVPLPPYIKNDNVDESYYQTVYAKKEGSVAAPTAGLHFTEKLIKELEKKGVSFARVGLHIGLDTFRPIKEREIEDHHMHKEYYYIHRKEAQKIRECKEKGGRVVAVGTTVARVLETVMEKHRDIIEDSGFSDLYIYPPFIFKIVDGLITNFHLPKTTLLVMVSAFGERENILKAYEEAKEYGYRFYSFGDCMFIK